MTEQEPTDRSISPLEEIDARLGKFDKHLKKAQEEHAQNMAALGAEAASLDADLAQAHETLTKATEGIFRVHEQMQEERGNVYARIMEIKDYLAPHKPFIDLLQYIRERAASHLDRHGGLAGLHIPLNFPENEAMQEVVPTLATGQKPDEGRPTYDVSNDRVDVITKVPSVIAGLWLDAEIRFRTSVWEEHRFFGEPESITYRSLRPAPPSAPMPE